MDCFSSPHRRSARVAIVTLMLRRGVTAGQVTEVREGAGSYGPGTLRPASCRLSPRRQACIYLGMATSKEFSLADAISLLTRTSRSLRRAVAWSSR